MNAIFTFIGIALLLIGGWALGHVIGGSTGSMDAVNFFVESSTMGTMVQGTRCTRTRYSTATT